MSQEAMIRLCIVLLLVTAESLDLRSGVAAFGLQLRKCRGLLRFPACRPCDKPASARRPAECHCPDAWARQRDRLDSQHLLDREDLVLTFMDTDNYSPAQAALRIVRERTVVGGAIVFDHFTGADRFRYTLGERIAGRVLLDDSRYFHLHDTGVFYRQR